MSDGGPPNSTSPGRWVFREFILDEDRAELRRGDNRIDMRAQSFAVLRLLVINHGRLVSRDTLLDEVWGDKIVTEDSLTHCLGDIRRALGDASQDMIRTVRGRGYIFEASVREEGVGRAQTAIAEAAATLWAGLKWQQLAAISASIVALIAIGLWMVGAQNDPIENVDIDRSIAVLPFVNMSSDPEQDYFSDGISEELLNLLAKVHQLRVVSRSSSFAYRGEDINILEVGNALNVAYVLEGSVRKAGDRIRITAQLIEASTDKHLWSETYDRDLVDIFAIQDEVSAQIIDQLKIELTGEAPHAYRTDPETYALFLRAKARLMQIGLYGDPEAVRIMEEVVASDPDYVPALMYLATIIGYESRNHGDQAIYPGELAERKKQELVDRTLAIDPNNAQAIIHT